MANQKKVYEMIKVKNIDKDEKYIRLFCKTEKATI